MTVRCEMFWRVTLTLTRAFRGYDRRGRERERITPRTVVLTVIREPCAAWLGELGRTTATTRSERATIRGMTSGASERSG
jgi:hypothetical protein